jgi:hypothetical protein
MTVTEANNAIGLLLPDHAKRRISPDLLRQAFAVVVGQVVEKITVATYADAVPLFVGTVPREIFVTADEAYGEGGKTWYKYVPGFGVALSGIDFNYTT